MSENPLRASSLPLAACAPSGKFFPHAERSILQHWMDHRRHITRCVVLFTLALFLGLPFAYAQPILFANTPWGSDVSTVKTRFEEHGFAFQGVSKEGRLVFRGRTFESPTTVVAELSDERLARVDVAVAADTEGALETYARVRGALAAKYGAPASDLLLFEPPYARGDGREAQAIRAGRGHLLAAWKEDGRTAMIVRVTKALMVTVSYEAPERRDGPNTALVDGADAF